MNKLSHWLFVKSEKRKSLKSGMGKRMLSIKNGVFLTPVVLNLQYEIDYCKLLFIRTE